MTTLENEMTASAASSGRQCAWRGADVDARNGRAEPGDPAPCGNWIFWDEHSGSWLHVVMRLDHDHKAIFGRSATLKETR